MLVWASVNTLEQKVRENPRDVGLRVTLYTERREQGLECPIRWPLLPLPDRPDFLKKKNAHMVRPIFYNSREPLDSQIKNTAFWGRLAEPVSIAHLTEVHRYFVAVLGHDRTFAMWSRFSVTPSPDAKVALGVVFYVLNEVEMIALGEIRREKADLESVRSTGLTADEWRAKQIRERADWEKRQAEVGK